MSLQFILGGSGSGKSHYIYKNIIESAKKEKRNYLIVVPDQFTMQTQKDLCTFACNDREGIMNIDVLSFSRLSYRIMEEVGEAGGIMLDDTGKNLILRRVAGEKKNELTVIGANLQKIGYIHEVKSLISEFYQYDIGKEELADLIEFADCKGALAYKLKDIRILRDAFADYIKGKYLTTEELLERLCEILPKSEIVKGSVIVLDGFTGFTPIQNKLIRQLMLLADKVIVTLVADSAEDVRSTLKEQEGQSSGEEQLFYLSRHTYESLSKIADEEKIKQCEDIVLTRSDGGNGNVRRFEKNAELGFLEQHLFRGENCAYEAEPEHIFMTEAPTCKKEIQAMLLQIQKLVREEGYAYRDIAVVTGDMTRYEHLFRTEFAYYGVPLYMDQTRGILFHPLSEFLRSLMEVFLNDFSKDSVLRFLRTALTDLSREEIDSLEIYIAQYGIRGRKRYEMIFTKGADRYDAQRLLAMNDSRQKLMDLLSPLLKLQLKEPIAAESIIQAVYDICVIARLQDKMEQYREQFEAGGELAKAREYAQVYQAVVDLLDQMYGLLSGEKMELSEFSQILEAGLSEITIGTIPQNVDQVVAGDIERTRLKQVRALFFIGVNDGAVPKGSKGGGLLSDMEREFLRGAGHELAPTPRQQIFMQRLYLYLNMTKPSESLYLSYSRVDNEGKTMRKSYLIGVMRKMFPMLKVTELSEQEPLSMIASKADGIDELAAMFAEYARGSLEQNKEKKAAFLALLDAYLKEDGAIVQEFMEAAFHTYMPQKLSHEIATALYGDIVESSVGRLEQFSACAYAHFLQYGLKLKEDAEYEVNSADIGTIYHEVMKRFAEFLKEHGYHWTDFSLDEADEFVDQTIQKLAREYENALFYSSEESLHAISDMAEVLKRSIHTLKYHMTKGLFEPKRFEVPFYMGEQIKAKGRIDRIDTFEKDGEVYVKVVDYKSGKNDFDPVAFYFGLKMQLAVYMKAAVLLEQNEQRDKHVIPAALVYYQFQNPFVEEENNELIGADGSVIKEALEEKIRKKMQITGLVSEEDTVIMALDREFETESDVMQLKRKKDGSFYKGSMTGTRKQFDLLMDYVDYKMSEVEKRVYEGEIAVNPYRRKDKNACQYCNYRSVCHFDERIGGYHMRNLDKATEEEAWDNIAKALGKEREDGN